MSGEESNNMKHSIAFGWGQDIKISQYGTLFELNPFETNNEYNHEHNPY